MKRFRKVYLEISNLCNLKCSFCPGTNRRPHALTVEEFTILAEKLRAWTDYLYFHLMGEPLLHSHLSEFLRIAGELGFRVILTTNGTLLRRQMPVLLTAPALHKVNISLHAFEANDFTRPFSEYLSDCFVFGREAEGKMIVTYRLWNGGGQNEKNGEILRLMREAFPGEWKTERRGTRVGERIYLENGDKFDWPDLEAADGGDRVFCYGLRDQIGVLADGSVVPCCLDHEGDLTLGNLFEQPMEEILSGTRAKSIYDGFSDGRAAEELCRKCGYARRFG